MSLPLETWRMSWRVLCARTIARRLRLPAHGLHSTHAVRSVGREKAMAAATGPSDEQNAQDCGRNHDKDYRERCAPVKSSIGVGVILSAADAHCSIDHRGDHLIDERVGESKNQANESHEVDVHLPPAARKRVVQEELLRGWSEGRGVAYGPARRR